MKDLTYLVDRSFRGLLDGYSSNCILGNNQSATYKYYAKNLA